MCSTHKCNFHIIVSSLFLSLGVNLSSWAQDEVTKIDEVIVTAQFRAEQAQSVPIAMSLYNKDALEKISAQSLTDIEHAVPNINFGSGGRDTRGEIAIRGIGGYSRNIGINARVAVYVDGVLTGRSSTFDQSLLDVEQIEILRGPQGTLFGANALAGAINITTQKPNENLSGKIQSNLGNFNLAAYTGKINVPLSSDLYASLLVSTTKQDGFIHNVTLNRDLQNQNRKTSNFKMRYVGIDNLTLDVGLDYLKDNNLATNALALADGPGALNGLTKAPYIREAAHNANEFENRELKGTHFTANYTTPENYQWLSITALRKSSFNELNEEDYSPLDVLTSLFNEKSEQLSQEFRFVSPKGEIVDFVLGAYLLNQDITTERGANAGALFRVPNAYVKTPAEVDERSYSAYGSVNIYIANNWDITGGIRAVKENKKINFTSEDTTGLFVNVNNLQDQRTFTKLLPKVDLNYHPSQQHLFYGSIARGYTGGGWNADFLRSLENFNFNPENAMNYEVGQKSTFLNERLKINTAAFITNIKDFQVFQFVRTDAGATITSLTNAGEVTSQGMELDVTAALFKDLTLGFNSAFTQSKFDEFKNGGGIGKNYDNHYLPFAPQHAHYLALDYEYSFSSRFLAYGHIDYGYTDNYFSHPDNAESNKTPAHYVTNLRLGVSIQNNWDIAFWVKNLTDKTNLRQKNTSFLGIYRGYYDPPRFLGLSLTYKL
jgi:iron complex outermembrane recepter protein